MEPFPPLPAGSRIAVSGVAPQRRIALPAPITSRSALRFVLGSVAAGMFGAARFVRKDGWSYGLVATLAIIALLGLAVCLAFLLLEPVFIEGVEEITFELRVLGWVVSRRVAAKNAILAIEVKPLPVGQADAKEIQIRTATATIERGGSQLTRAEIDWLLAALRSLLPVTPPPPAQADAPRPNPVLPRADNTDRLSRFGNARRKEHRVFFPSSRSNRVVMLLLAIAMTLCAVVIPADFPGRQVFWVPALVSYGFLVWRFRQIEQLILEPDAMRWRYRHGLWPKLTVEQGSFDAFGGLALDVVVTRGTAGKVQGINWVVSLLFRDRPKPLPLENFVFKQHAYSTITALARELRLPAFDRLGETPEPLPMGPV